MTNPKFMLSMAAIAILSGTNALAQDDTTCDTTYADKNGKYQKQQGITLPRILK